MYRLTPAEAEKTNRNEAVNVQKIPNHMNIPLILCHVHQVITYFRFSFFCDNIFHSTGVSASDDLADTCPCCYGYWQEIWMVGTGFQAQFWVWWICGQCWQNCGLGTRLGSFRSLWPRLASISLKSMVKTKIGLLFINFCRYFCSFSLP